VGIEGGSCGLPFDSRDTLRSYGTVCNKPRAEEASFRDLLAVRWAQKRGTCSKEKGDTKCTSTL
jgi:hypothetical protein